MSYSLIQIKKSIADWIDSDEKFSNYTVNLMVSHLMVLHYIQH